VINWTEKVKEKLHDREDRDVRDPEVFSSYYAGYCPRQIYIRKMRLSDMDLSGLGAVKMGSLIHEWLEDSIEDVEFEKQFTLVEDGLRIEGRADAVDDNAVYDFKSTASLNYTDKPEHRRQLMVYMKAFNKDRGKLVYLSKKNLEVEEVEVEYDEEVYRKWLRSIKRLGMLLFLLVSQNLLVRFLLRSVVVGYVKTKK